MTRARSVLDRVSELIAAGLHLDEVPGKPGLGLAGGGMFRGDCRLYYRGTSEFATAAAGGLLDRLPPPPPPASRAAIDEAESMVRSPLPELLKDLYALANGGFGPGYGILGVSGGFADDMNRTAIEILAEVPKGYWRNATRAVPAMPLGLRDLQLRSLPVGPHLRLGPESRRARRRRSILRAGV